MTLADFESKIDSRILDRGLEYYESDQIISLESDGKCWIAEVRGSEIYTVTVEVSNSGKINDMDCDCPYDFGPVCKHEAAVLYALQKMGKKVLEKPGPTKLERLKSILEGIDKNQLITMLLGLAANDRLIRDELLTWFSVETDLLRSVREMIKSSIKSAMQRGFVEYGDVDMAVNGAEKALEIASFRNNTGDSLTAVSLCITVLREMVKLLNCCDDSDGIVGDVISNAVHLIQDSTKNSKDGDGKLFELIFNHMAEKIYDGWDEWRFEMLDACVPFCADPSLRKKLEAYLDSCASAAEDDFHTEWAANQTQKIHRHIIEAFDGPEAADIYLEKNMESNEDFRKIAVEKAIAAKNYDRALQLCLDGEQKNKERPGLASDYRHKRNTVYERQKNISGQKDLVRVFVLDGEFNYYKKLKKLYTKTEWPGVLAGLIENLENARYTSRVYIDICIQEHLWEKLLVVCQKQPDYLVMLYPHLVPRYAAELSPVFAASIRKDVQNASNRGGYQRVCELIDHYKRACGKPEAEKLIAELRETYRRRSAFIDELGKIKI